MRLLFLCNRDMASYYALGQLLPVLNGQHELHLWFSSKVGGSKPQIDELNQLKQREQDLFFDAVQMKYDLPATLTGFEPFQPFLHTIPLKVQQINDKKCCEHLSELSPDAVISIRFGGILKHPALNALNVPVLNLHSGILPQYRGVMATFWAMKHGADILGMTLHTIDDGSIDTGEVIEISSCPIVKGKSYLWNVMQLYPMGCQAVLRAINRLHEGECLTVSQQTGNANYFSFPSRQDIESFLNQGYSLINHDEYQCLLKEVIKDY